MTACTDLGLTNLANDVRRCPGISAVRSVSSSLLSTPRVQELASAMCDPAPCSVAMATSTFMPGTSQSLRSKRITSSRRSAVLTTLLQPRLMVMLSHGPMHMLAQAPHLRQLQAQGPLKIEWPLLHQTRLLHQLLQLLQRLLSLLSMQGPGIGDVKHTMMQQAKPLTDLSFSTIMVVKVLACSISRYPYPTFFLPVLTILSTWGNSLSYASPDGKTGSASPQTLADTLIDDDVEIVIMTDKPCSNGDCGTVRPGTVAYR